jgi:hypothetical protein
MTAGKQNAKTLIKTIFTGMMIVLLVPAVAFAGAPQSSSSSYQVDEVFFGSGGALNSCSSSYCTKQSAGEVAIGNTSSASYQAQAGFNTDRNPYIQINVNNTNVNVGTLTTSTTATANATFTVKAYLAQGYVVTTVSPPPSNGGYTMQALSTPTASSTGVEQFGMNLRANSAPITFGADPNQLPDPSFSFGQPESNYDTPNAYMYHQGDAIADSSTSSGDTEYTLSYIFNISHVTPGGTYTFDDVLVATGTY